MTASTTDRRLKAIYGAFAKSPYNIDIDERTYQESFQGGLHRVNFTYIFTVVFIIFILMLTTNIFNKYVKMF